MDLNELQSLAKKLPQHQPDAERSAIIRESLLSAAKKEIPHTRPRNLWLPLAALAAAALAFYAGSRSSTSNPISVPSGGQQLTFATLGSEDGAKFSRELNPVTNVEEVSLTEGGLHVDSQKSRDILVRVRDAEIHGIAAVFDVRASGDQLHSVRVQSGRVELHIENQSAIIIAPGQKWSDAQIVERIELALRARRNVGQEAVNELNEESDDESKGEIASVAIHVPPAKPEPTKSTVANNSAIAAPETNKPAHASRNLVLNESNTVPVAAPAELAFAKGFRALKRRGYTKAIAAFNSAIELGSDNAMRGDSRYWLSVALAKSGKNSQAIQAMSGFLRHHGDSSRAGEVSTMLGWLYVEKGQLERAAGLFERGLTGASAKVRKSAKAGLESISSSPKGVGGK